MTRGAGRLGPAPDLAIGCTGDGVRRKADLHPVVAGAIAREEARGHARAILGGRLSLGALPIPSLHRQRNRPRGSRLAAPHDRLTPAPAGGGRSPSGGISRAPRRPFPPSDPGQEADERRPRAPATRTPRPRLMSDDRRLEELEADARHASERYRLYRAKVNGPRPTTTGRLRELERESERAQRTLARARETQAAG